MTPTDGTSLPPIEIRQLCPALMADFLQFFDGEAFADNPKWGFCFCQFLYVDHNKVHWPSRSVQENRAAACERICSERMQGYLAYRDGKPVGWCNAAPRAMLDAFADEPDPDAARMGQITCFVVAKSHRRSGVATALLHAACAGLRAQGLDIAEAMPLADASSDAQNHFGPLGMYLAAGFQVHRTDDEGRVHVRRSLVQAMNPPPPVSVVLAKLRAAGVELPPGDVRVDGYGDSPELSASLLALIRDGRKRAGTSLLWGLEADGESLPRAGQVEVVVDHRDEPALVTRITRVQVVPFDQVSAEYAAIEGEGDGSLAQWREGHWAFFSRECRRIGREPSRSMPVVCSEFELLAVLPA